MKLKQNAPGKTLEKYTNRTKGSFGFDTEFNNTNETCFLFLLLKYLLYYLVTVFFIYLNLIFKVIVREAKEGK